MDLWKEFEMNERMADFWQELGMSAGTAIIVLIVLYFIIKWAVKNGMLEAYQEIKKTKKNKKQKKHTNDSLTTDQNNGNFGFNDDKASSK